MSDDLADFAMLHEVLQRLMLAQAGELRPRHPAPHPTHNTRAHEPILFTMENPHV